MSRGFFIYVCLNFLVMPLISGCSATDPQGGFTDAQEAEKVAAAKSTAQNNSNCTAIAPFYWEIGNVDSILASGTTGNGSVTRTTKNPIGSATKWLFGAYVLEYRGGAPQSVDIPYLTMTSGYSLFTNGSCAVGSGVSTVQQCYAASTNSNYDASTNGQFFYNGGHFQVWANNIGGLGSNGLAALRTKFVTALGTNTDITFVSPQLAGGAYMSAAGYAEFLRRIISGQLLIKNYLGANKVCTLPGSSGCNAQSSPLASNNLAFHYSYGHWVEDDSTGDGSFSSAGVFGFYPWIDSTKRYYGILSRYDSSSSDDSGNGYASYICGKAIRRAYMTGTAQ